MRLGGGEAGQDVLQGIHRKIGSVFQTPGLFYLFSVSGVNNGAHRKHGGESIRERQSGDNLQTREKALRCPDASASLRGTG